MSTINYKCDVCKREIQLLEITSGLTVFSKCIITDNCKGKLHKISRNQDSIREVLPDSVVGVGNYVPRKALFSHNQNILSKNWKINHNLETFPVVAVYNEDLDNVITQLTPDKFTIEIIDKNTLNVKFPTPLKGIAQCLVRSSDNTKSATLATSNLVQVTTNGLITLAIPERIVQGYPNPDILQEDRDFSLGILVNKPSVESISCAEIIKPVLLFGSPWATWSNILLRKRKNYLVRTKSIFDLLSLGLNVTPDEIPDGTLFRFETIQFYNSPSKTIDSRDLYFLLTNSPFESVDKVKNKVIDVGTMLNSKINYFIYSNGELYTDISNIETIYPDIVRDT